MRRHKITISIGALLVLVILFGVRMRVPKVDTFAEPSDPVALTAEAEEAWESVGACMNASWADPDFRYTRGEVPESGIGSVVIWNCWEQEREKFIQ